MRHDKTLSRKDGSRVKIEVFVYLNSVKGPIYDVSVFTCAPNKRKFQSLCQDGNYEWRSLSMEDKRKSDYALMLKYVTEDEIWAAKIALWEKLKPMV